jgi:hypothetical protein
LLNLHVVCRIDLVIVGLLVVVEQYSKRKWIQKFNNYGLFIPRMDLVD